MLPARIASAYKLDGNRSDRRRMSLIARPVAETPRKLRGTYEHTVIRISADKRTRKTGYIACSPNPYSRSEDALALQGESIYRLRSRQQQLIKAAPSETETLGRAV